MITALLFALVNKYLLLYIEKSRNICYYSQCAQKYLFYWVLKTKMEGDFMFCPECGVQNNDGSKFCCNCAKPLVATAYNDANKKEVKKKMHSAHLLNIISAVVLVLSFLLIQYGVSTSTGGLSSSTTTGNTTTSTNTTIQFDISGADDAYTAIYVGAAVAVLGLVLYFLKNESPKKAMAYIYLVGAFVATCLQFLAGVKTISFTCGLGFVLVVAGILQIVAGTKFLSAVKNA